MMYLLLHLFSAESGNNTWKFHCYWLLMRQNMGKKCLLIMEAINFLGIIVITVINILYQTAKYFVLMNKIEFVAFAMSFLQTDF